jgi:LacI family transcriptional regulator
MSKRKITSKDVAKAAGVSPTTVSFVLNNIETANISPETQQRVRDAVRDLGYVPNASAISLKQGRSSNVGLALIQPHEQIFLDLFVPKLLTGLANVLRPQGLRLLVERIDGWKEYESILNMLRGHEVAGMIVLCPKSNQELLAHLLEQEIPIVVIGRMNDKIPYSVTSDNLAGVREIVTHLIHLGHHRIGCISYAPENVIDHATDRLNTYYQTLMLAGITPDQNLVRYGNFEPDSGYKAMRELLHVDPLPTAVFGMNDMMAIGAMSAIQEAGLRVPEDIAVVGFDDDRFAAFTNPPLTTVRESQRELGQQAGELLIEIMNGIEPSQPHLLLPTQMVIRKSCGAG